jgi:hypothetical protein
LSLGFAAALALSTCFVGDARAQQPPPSGPTTPGVGPGGKIDPAARQAAGRAAKAQYDEGERAFKKGDFRRAAELFENAYRIFPHHSALWAAARAWIRAGEDVRGANLLEQFLNEAPANAPDRDRATEVITEFEKRVGRIEVLANDVTDVKLDGEPIALPRVWVVPGDHVATADANGKPVRKIVTVAAGDRISVTLEPPPPPVEPPPPIDRPVRPLPSWVVFAGGGVALLGAGLITISGLDTLQKRNAFIDYAAKSNQPGYDSGFAQGRLDDANAAQSRTNVILGATIGVAALTTLAAIFLVDWSSPAAPAPTTGATNRLRPPRLR